jgi:hypothetical protein
VKVYRSSMAAMFYVILVHNFVDRDSAVGIATRYELYSPGIECRWGRDFSRPSRPARVPDPLSLVCNGYRVLLGSKAAGAWR